MFVAPSQIHRLAQRFSGKIFRVHVRREGDRDLLVVRIEGAPGTQGDGWAGDEEFKRGFRDLCTVGVDRLEWVPKGTLAAADRQLVDERDWR
jgi:phenylacetate-CoA ligase